MQRHDVLHSEHIALIASDHNVAYIHTMVAVFEPRSDGIAVSRGVVALKMPVESTTSAQHCGASPGFACFVRSGCGCLAAEAVQGAALALQGVHHVHGSDGLAASVLGVGH